MHAFSVLMGLALAGVSAVQAHMQLEFPPALNARNNPHRSGDGDDTYVYPMGCCGADVTEVCRGYLDLLGTPAGASVASFEAGSKATFNITGDPEITGNDLGSTHYGGSCQVGFSTDGGKSFKVAASYEGNCPHRNSDESSGQDFDFTVPADLPAGDAVFAWTWINREQEFNMNCAAVTIVNSGYSSKSRSLSKAVEPSTPVAVQTPTTPMPLVATPSSMDAAPTPTPSADASDDDSKKFQLEWCSCKCDTADKSTEEKEAYDADNCTCRCWKTPKSLAARTTEPRMARHVHHRAISNFLGFGASAKSDKSVAMKRDVSWDARPKMLIPNPVWHDCSLPKTDAELQFPDPGPEVIKGDGEYPLALPETGCSSY
ncbi:lytic polysaccharide monooxygenase [Aplosporella prunicola CBS 121167]|uniref:Lytic polysaccharide monooxygenase n=1 Tax=Aplosporella prunicola CBS 121167 TaxID=1176127 RepID=A0A6A6BIA4_9PEZI|nr:lytic polysaccharide monooxygenase [Aplosporella prunicola CBS 121167]KAF2143348.1 lytic polysaccharide monooxygenase [Aplosporella prunicola CBS 121167]